MMAKKHILLLSALLFAACSHDTEFLENEGLNGSSSAHVSVPDFAWEESRTTIAPTADGMSFAWKTGDQLAVYGPSGTTLTNFDIDMNSVSGDAKSADFTNCEFGLKTESTYYAVYPANFSATNGHAYPVDYTAQTQDGNNNADHLSAYDYMAAKGEADANDAVAFNLQHLGAILRVSVDFDEACSVNALSITADDATFATVGTVNLLDETPAVTSTATNATMTLNLQNVTLTDDNKTLVAYLLVAPVDLSGKTLTVSVVTGGKTYKKTGIAGKNIEAGKAYAISGKVTTLQFVDLELPSGALWATCNLGADNPEEYGKYYQWGDTQGYTSDVSDGHSFNWAAYKYCTSSATTLTKYCTQESSWAGEGEMDNKSELDLEDDAVYQEMGEGWRIPSLEQWNELNSSENCSKSWTTLNNVNGWLFTSKKNGKTLFLPAAGCRLNAKFQYSVTSGYYWSRTLYTQSPGYACRLYFESSEVITYYIGNYRYRGFSLRGVKL